MKSKLMKITIPLVIILSLLNLSNESPSREVIEAGNKYENDEYMNLFRIPNTFFTFSSSGGERPSNILNNAFDGNWNTCWISGTENTDSFKTEVTINFNQTLNLAGMIYQCQNYYTQGYPNIIVFKYKLNGETEYKEIRYQSPNDTDQRVIFHFGEAITCDQLVIRWELITKNKLTNVATAREIIFVQPEEELLYKSLKMFTYNYLGLTEGFNTLEKINQLEEEGKKNINFEGALKEKIARARGILSGAYKKNNRREFTTDPKNKEAIYIRQNGDNHGYAQGVLKMAWIGLDRQPTGIYGRGGQEIIVYVDALPDDPLPKIIYTQCMGHYSSWQEGSPTLKLGKNVLTFYQFNTNGYAHPMVSGGPMYISNLYTKDQQSTKLKIYIENGIIFPVFRKGDDEKKFISFLEDYVSYYRNLESQGYYDLVELYGDRTLVTADADRARLKYTLLEGQGPQKNLENWDEFLLKLLKFDGVQMDPKQPHYDPRASHLGINYRYSQQFGLAYAGYDHIGIFHVDWLDTVLYGEGFGWGYAHEIGHEMESNLRGIGEATNNMIAKYYEDACQRASSDGHWEESVIYLTPDGINPMERCERNGTKVQYWRMIDLNYLVWWTIECYFHGFWGKLDNIFRYEQVNETGLTNPEKQVLYSSIAVGYNLSYYYERWGYDFRGGSDNPVFAYNSSSAQFKGFMEQFVSEKKIKNDKQPKLWYLDRKEYNFLVDNGQVGCSYSTSQKINLLTIVKLSDTSFKLVMPTSTCKAHLGYEIYINGALKNFTYANSFTVNNASANTNFSIAAYDRLLDYTATSDPLSYSGIKPTQVCSIGNKNYTSLQDAFNEINNDETVVIFSDILADKTATFNKNINITIQISQDRNIYVYKTFSGTLLDIQQGNVTILGKSDSHRLIFDSYIANNGRLIVVKNSARLIGKYITVQNIQTNEKGGGIELEGSAYIDLSYSLIHNCKADHGGGIQLSNKNNGGIIKNVKFTSNSCTNYGGALRNVGTLTVQDCEFTESLGSCKYGSGISNDNGGVIDIISSTFKKNSGNNGIIFVDGVTRINGCTITENTANNGAAIFESTIRGLALFISGNTKIYKNYAKSKAGAIYVNSGQASIYGGEIHDNTISTISAAIKANDEPENNNANTIYINRAASINLNSDCKINGNLFLETGGLFIANASMPSPYNKQKVTVNFPVAEGETSIIQAQNFTLTNDDLKKINLVTSIGGALRIDEASNSAKFKLGECRATVVIKFGKSIYSENITELVPCGTEFDIMEYFIFDYPEYYLDYLVDDRGRMYEENPILDFNLTFTLQYNLYRYVTLNYFDSSYTHDIYDGFEFCLPAYRPDQTFRADNNYEIYSYRDPDGKIYNTDDCFKVTKNLTFFANYNKFLLITLIVNEKSIPGKLVDCGFEYELPREVEGAPIDFWYIDNGTKIESGTKVEINRDIIFYDTLPKKSKEGGSNKTLIIIIAIACVILIIAVVVGICFCRRKSKMGKTDGTDGNPLLVN